jgi:hypothetical protein
MYDQQQQIAHAIIRRTDGDRMRRVRARALQDRSSVAASACANHRVERTNERLRMNSAAMSNERNRTNTDSTSSASARCSSSRCAVHCATARSFTASLCPNSCGQRGRFRNNKRANKHSAIETNHLRLQQVHVTHQHTQTNNKCGTWRASSAAVARASSSARAAHSASNCSD